MLKRSGNLPKISGSRLGGTEQSGQKIILKFAGFLTLTALILSACAAPPPPVSKSQLDEAKTAALNVERQVADQNAEIKVLEQELQEKETELQNLKMYEQQLKNEGFLEEE